MDAPDRDDEPVESWEYRGHQCHVYSSDDPTDGETVWAGYARTKLPDAEDFDNFDVSVPGELTSGVDEGWVGFSTSNDSRTADQTRADVEQLVDQIVELETSMDG